MKNDFKKCVGMKAEFSAFNFYFVGIKERPFRKQTDFLVACTSECYFQVRNYRSSYIGSLGGSVTF